MNFKAIRSNNFDWQFTKNALKAGRREGIKNSKCKIKNGCSRYYYDKL